MHDADYIIVGAGSAGCVLASRLTEDLDADVVLFEAGGSDRSLIIQMPAALSMPMNTRRFNWRFTTEPEPFLNNRILDCPRGLCLGGSSSINGMVYVRGHPRDFDCWEEHGAAGWNYQTCLPYFRKSETWSGGADQYRGSNGPVAVCAGSEMRLNPMYQAFIDAGKEAGYPVTLDYNGYQQEGFGPMHMTVNAGVRASTANAYLRPAMKRENLRLVVDTTVHRVLVKDRRAVGIEYMKDGQMFSIRARKEVILSAGSIGSPILLQRSGLGPRQVLHDAGVECIEDLRGVGENLQDHLEVYFQYQCLRPISLNGKLGLIEKAKIGARWLLLRSGLGATNQFESCGFIRSRAGVEWPDIQYHFFPGAMRYDGRAAFEGHGFQVHVGPNRPASRGRVQIRSANSSAAPSILFNYLSEEKDRDNFRQCIRLSREVLTQSALSKYRGAEIQPGLDVTSNIDIDAWVRQNCESAYHPSCTCKMGAQDDPLAVLDSECRVRKIDGLRIVDSSIFPAITNGNLNAPTIMAAERAADMIRGRDLLPSANAPVWIDPHWQTRQRFGETPDSR